jgi:hypothetical protein
MKHGNPKDLKTQTYVRYLATSTVTSTASVGSYTNPQVVSGLSATQIYSSDTVQSANNLPLTTVATSATSAGSSTNVQTTSILFTAQNVLNDTFQSPNNAPFTTVATSATGMNFCARKTILEMCYFGLVNMVLKHISTVYVSSRSFQRRSDTYVVCLNEPAATWPLFPCFADFDATHEIT